MLILYMTDINKCYETNPYTDLVADVSKLYIDVYNKHNDLLIRIVGVTDDILREQLQDEYLMYHKTISDTELQVKEAYKKYIRHVSNEWLDELRAMYLCGLEETNFMEVMKCINLEAECKRLRFRPITSFDQRRELVLLLNELDFSIKVIDLESIVIENIGKGKKLITVKQPCFSRLNETTNKYVK
jgi:hypothetical protein